MSKIQAVIFDKDGTLHDTETVFFEAWKRAAVDCGGIPDIEDTIRACTGVNLTDTKVFWTGKYPHIPFEEFLARRNVHFDEIVKDGVPVKPGAYELLAYLREHGYKIALATSTRKEGALNHLTKAGILEYFDVLTTGDMFTHGKPDPEIYLTACRLLGSDPAETYAVEDSYPGLESAHRAGMKPVMIPDLFPPTEYTRSIAAEYPSLTALMHGLQA